MYITGSGNWDDISTGKMYQASGTLQIRVNGTMKDSTQLMHSGNCVMVSGLAKEQINVNRPVLVADDNGIITEYANKRVLISDNRFARGSNNASGVNREILQVATTPGNKPSSKYKLNWNEPIDTVPIKGGSNTSSVAEGEGTIVASQLSATVSGSLNKNVLCWNVSSNSAYVASSSAEYAYFGSKRVVASIQNGLSLKRIMFSTAWSDAGTGYAQIHVPDVKIQSLASHTTSMAASDFVSNTNDDEKWTKLSALKNNFNCSGSGILGRNTFIYEGLKLMSAHNEGMLTLSLRFDKSTLTDNTNGISYTFWDDGTDATKKIRVYIKDKPFLNGDDYSECIPFKVDSGTEATTYLVNPGTIGTYSFHVEKNKDYFIRWMVDGKEYGGELVYASDAKLQIDN